MGTAMAIGSVVDKSELQKYECERRNVNVRALASYIACASDEAMRAASNNQRINLHIVP